MGNATSISAAAPVDPAKDLPQDLPKFIIKRLLSKESRIKTYEGKFDGAPVIVKCYTRDPQETLDEVAMRLTKLWRSINPANFPNLLPYQMWLKAGVGSQRNYRALGCYLIRQRLCHSLYDRLSTRPFLLGMERKFIIFQMFVAVQTAHDQGICHGDLKLNNFLVSSWNWVVLTDFSGAYKPTCLPVDNPSAFLTFFNTMNRNRCYIAPERFISASPGSAATAAAAAAVTAATVPNKAHSRSEASSQQQQQPQAQAQPSTSTTDSNNSSSERKVDSTANASSSNSNSNSSNKNPPTELTPAMDVFSLGCCIAELSTGSVLLDFPTALQVRLLNWSYERQAKEKEKPTEHHI